MDAAMLVNGVMVDEDWCDHVVGSALIERSNTNGAKNAGTEENSDKSEDKEKEGTESKDGNDEHQAQTYLPCLSTSTPWVVRQRASIWK